MAQRETLQASVSAVETAATLRALRVSYVSMARLLQTKEQTAASGKVAPKQITHHQNHIQDTPVSDFQPKNQP